MEGWQSPVYCVRLENERVLKRPTGSNPVSSALIMSQTLFTSTGTLRYGLTNLVLDVNQDIVEYYRALLPKWIRTNKQMYPAHISVVRHETPPNMELWNKYAGEEIQFSYSHEIRNSEIYYWLDAWCERLEEIRLELGLPVDSPYTRPPDGFAKTFHITIGNRKNM